MHGMACTSQQSPQCRGDMRFIVHTQNARHRWWENTFGHCLGNGHPYPPFAVNGIGGVKASI
jgi:hypothetical protein